MKLPKKVEERFNEIFTSKIPEKGGGYRIFLTPTEKQLVKNFISQELSKRDEEVRSAIPKKKDENVDVCYSQPYAHGYNQAIKDIKNNLIK
jgi:hypothetical protein